MQRGRPKKNKENFPSVALPKQAPEGMSRVVTYSNPDSIARGEKRYRVEKADVYLKAKFQGIEDKYRKGQAVMNRNNMTAPERKILEGWVLHRMIREGLSRKAIMDIMEDEWNVDRSAAATMMSFVLNQLVETDEKQRERGKAVYFERLENLYASCMKRNDTANALKVLEQMAKARGFYNDTTVVAPVMNFKFGNEPSMIEIPPESVHPAEEVKEIPEELKEEFNWS